MCPKNARAWHAGVSYWAGARDINARSIGIEIVNPGHEFGYRSFPGRADRSGDRACARYLARHPIPPERVLGHSDVAPARKTDPGRAVSLGRAWRSPGIGFWPQTRKAHLDVPFEDGLRAFGYGLRPDMDVSTRP